MQPEQTKEADGYLCTWDDSYTTKRSTELVKTFYTKQTPIFKVKFTKRNLLLAGGPFAKTDDEIVV